MISRGHRTAVLVLLSVLLVGIAFGLVLEEVADDIDWPSFQGDRSAGPGRNGDRGIGLAGRADAPMHDAEEEFLEGLGLSGAQHEAVERLLDEREDRLQAYWAGKLPEIEVLIDSTRMAIRRLLPPDHQAAYDRWVARQRARVPRQ